MSSLYNFAEVEAKTAKPTTINNIIKEVLRADKGACYEEVERFLMPPGPSGSRSFDQAYAVETLLKHDSEHGGRLAIIIESTKMSRRLLWDRLQAVLRDTGFKMKHGRLVGILEDKRSEDEKNGDAGQPDID